MTKLKLYILMAVIFIAGCEQFHTPGQKYQEALVKMQEFPIIWSITAHWYGEHSSEKHYQ
jgi:hypothetical protein